MTIDDRADLTDDAIDWPNLLDALAEAKSFADMVGPLHRSGVLISDYRHHEPEDVEFDELPGDLDVLALRALLTSLIRENEFVVGTGDAYYWDETLDTVIDALAERLGVVYPLPLPEYVLPRRIPPCPTCGRTDRIQVRIVGMPPAPPDGFDTDRVIFEGCMVPEEPTPAFRCARCAVDFDPPGYDPFDASDFGMEDAP